MKEQKDRLKDYFTGRLDDMLFVELSDDFLEKAGAESYLKGVPVPVAKADLPGFAGGAGLKTAQLGERMVEVIGCDPDFNYRDNYVAFLRHAFDDKLIDVVLGRAAEAADKGDLKDACVQFRAALVLDEKNVAAGFGYARACQDIYISSEDDEEIGNFKAESLELFERMTLEHPEVAEGHYYLGYAYVNMGLYTKAKIAWEEFVRLRMEEVRSGSEGSEEEPADGSGDGNFRVPEEVTEIRGRLAQLEEPVRIEEGCNHIIAGRYEQGAEILEEFEDGPHGNWWPMHFYLGTAYREMGQPEKAIESFKSVLRLNASHADSMQELAELYGEMSRMSAPDDPAGENSEVSAKEQYAQLEQKYRKKLMLVRNMQ